MLEYSGDVSPRQCWQALSEATLGGVLIDVRSASELATDGVPHTEEGMQPVIFHQWPQTPYMNADYDFGASLEDVLGRAGIGKDDTLFFLCRAGIRSRAAAIEASKRGYKQTFNIAGGFDGHANAYGHQGTMNGWKAEGLPWQQQRTWSHSETWWRK